MSKSTEDKTKNQRLSCSEKGDNCRWLIDPPNGPVSMGKCSKCGIEKEFKNSFEYNTWHGERPAKKESDNKQEKSKQEKSKQEKSK